MPIELALMARFNWSYPELELTPNYLVEVAKVVIQAEAEGHQIRESWEKK
jgi:hypothetical protein